MLIQLLVEHREAVLGAAEQQERGAQPPLKARVVGPGGERLLQQLRRAELLALTLESLQQREEHWVIADLLGKGGHVRTVPVPAWVKAAVDRWTTAAGGSASSRNASHDPRRRPRAGGKRLPLAT